MSSSPCIWRFGYSCYVKCYIQYMQDKGILLYLILLLLQHKLLQDSHLFFCYFRGECADVLPDAVVSEIIWISKARETLLEWWLSDEKEDEEFQISLSVTKTVTLLILQLFSSNVQSRRSNPMTWVSQLASISIQLNERIIYSFTVMFYLRSLLQILRIWNFLLIYYIISNNCLLLLPISRL